MQEIPIPGPLMSLAKLWAQAGATLYGVGGIVRNALLQLPPSDLDICSQMMPDAVVELCEKNRIRCIAKAIEFGTVELHYGGLSFEHTTFRGQEKYGPGGGHRPERVKLGAGLEADAFRRDFTCNALYVDILSGGVLDPTGGLMDIENRMLRSTTTDPRIILTDDGLRILRLIRFACELGFSLDESTYQAARECVGGLKDIAWERKRDELSKILLSDARYPALPKPLGSSVLYGLRLIKDIGAMPYLLPELLDGELVRQRPRFHRYNVMEHNFYACAHTPPNLILRLAALLHDVGKPAALLEKGLTLDAGGYDDVPAQIILPHGSTPMLGHDLLGGNISREMLTRLRYPNKVIDEVVSIILDHMYGLGGNAKETTLRAKFAAWGEAHTKNVLAIREADVRGSGYETQWRAERWREILQTMRREGAPFHEKELACTGRDIMEWLELPPGPKVGEIKRRLLLHCARHPKDNTKARLQKIVRGFN